jgi:hypothetical protein
MNFSEISPSDMTAWVNAVCQSIIAIAAAVATVYGIYLKAKNDVHDADRREQLEVSHQESRPDHESTSKGSANSSIVKEASHEQRH